MHATGAGASGMHGTGHSKACEFTYNLISNTGKRLASGTRLPVFHPRNIPSLLNENPSGPTKLR